MAVVRVLILFNYINTYHPDVLGFVISSVSKTKIIISIISIIKWFIFYGCWQSVNLYVYIEHKSQKLIILYNICQRLNNLKNCF